MVREARDEWPEDVPVGTFDIGLNGTQGYPDATAHIIFVCPNRKRCSVLLGPRQVPRPAEGKLNIWAWDGDLERPTITPSIDCRGGCGWHGSITEGVMR